MKFRVTADDPVSQSVFIDWIQDNPPYWSDKVGVDQYGVWADFLIDGVKQRMRRIQPGTFWMGSPEDEEGRDADEGPRHQVQITQGFWMFDSQCTQELWEAVMGENPSHFKGKDRPVESVSWEDCQVFLTKVNQVIPELDLQLPTEAQWEYACRTGTEGARYSDNLDAIAWHGGNSGGETHPVKQKKPNEWGLFDMLGNVWEWCHDGQREYTNENQVDPVEPTGTERVSRGGSWFSSGLFCRAAYRISLNPSYRCLILGFRLVCLT